MCASSCVILTIAWISGGQTVCRDTLVCRGECSGVSRKKIENYKKGHFWRKAQKYSILLGKNARGVSRKNFLWTGVSRPKKVWPPLAWMHAKTLNKKERREKKKFIHRL